MTLEMNKKPTKQFKGILYKILDIHNEVFSYETENILILKIKNKSSLLGEYSRHISLYRISEV